MSPAVDEAVRRLGYAACRLDGGDPAATAVLVWQALGPKRNVLLVSGQDHTEAMLAGGWAAHMGGPILLAGDETLPQITACAITRMQPDVYIIGGPESISPALEGSVRRLTDGFVARIGGRDPVETAVNFTRYRSPTGRVTKRYGKAKKNGTAAIPVRLGKGYLLELTSMLEGGRLRHHAQWRNRMRTRIRTTRRI